MKTRDKIKEEFINQGNTIQSWAIEHGYKPSTVYAVLNGKIKGYYGVSHKIAVDLGIKEA